MCALEQRPAGGSTSAAISNAVVKLLHEYTGRGPTRARTILRDEVVVVILRNTLTKAERKLADDGEPGTVQNMRSRIQGTMREDLCNAVEEHTGRHVIAFMSANHLDPDMAAEIFILEPAETDQSPEPTAPL